MRMCDSGVVQIRRVDEGEDIFHAGDPCIYPMVLMYIGDRVCYLSHVRLATNVDARRACYYTVSCLNRDIVSAWGLLVMCNRFFCFVITP